MSSGNQTGKGDSDACPSETITTLSSEGKLSVKKETTDKSIMRPILIGGEKPIGNSGEEKFDFKGCQRSQTDKVRLPEEFYRQSTPKEKKMKELWGIS